MPMFNLLEYSNNYSKTSQNLWQYCRDAPVDYDITDFELFKFKSRFANNAGNAGTVNVEIDVPFKMHM